MKSVQTIYGVFDTDLGRLVGLAPQGVPDVTYLAGQDTQTDGIPVTSKTNPVTGGIEVSVMGVDLLNQPQLYKQKTDFMTSAFSVVDDMTGAAVAWNNNRSGCALSDSTEVIRESNGVFNALRVDVTGAYTRFQRAIMPVILLGTVNFWLYFDADPTYGSSVEVYLSSDGFATKNIKYTFAQANGFRRGWNCLSINTSDTALTTGASVVVTGGESFANAVNGIRFIFNSLAVGQVLRIGGIFQGGKAKSNVMLCFDDQYDSVWMLFNILRARGIRASLGVISSKVGAAGRLTLDQLKEIYAWGWDLAPHSATHPVGGLAGLSEADARYELQESRDYLLRNGLSRTANCFFWPQNAYVSSVGVDLIALARSVGYRVARGSTRRDLPTAQGIDNPMRLPSADFGGRTLMQAKSIIDASILYGQTNILYGHKLVGSATSPASGGTPPVDALEWNWSDYVAFADYFASKVAAGQVCDITVSDLMSSCRY